LFFQYDRFIVGFGYAYWPKNIYSGRKREETREGALSEREVAGSTLTLMKTYRLSNESLKAGL